MVWNIDVDSVSASQAETRAAPGCPSPPKHGPGAATAFDGGSRHWSILTKSRGGVVSVIRDLTLDQAKGMHSRLQPDYGVFLKRYMIGPDDYIEHGASYRDNGSLDLIVAFGPPGWSPDDVKNWEEWPKIEYVAVGAHSYRRCPECARETDAPEGARECTESHGNSYYGESSHCPIWVDGETEAEYEAGGQSATEKINRGMGTRVGDAQEGA